jgi:16S rRNA (guanine966-N2)-methyltransferase
LGIEALSRGAAGAVFVERDRGAAAMLNASLERLGAVGAEVIVADAGRYLRGTPASFDLVFLDPPFHAGGPSGLGQLCTLLAQGWLAAGARVYLEMPASELVPALPPPWQLLRDKTAGQVRYALAAWSPAER